MSGTFSPEGAKAAASWDQGLPKMQMRDITVPRAIPRHMRVFPKDASPDLAWLAIMIKVRNYGRFSPRDGMIPANYGLEDIRGDAAGSHRADYINLWGQVDGAGVFQPTTVTMVSEDWTLTPEGKWSIDQWIFELYPEGLLILATHATLIETLDHRVEDIRNDPLSDTDPRIQSEFAALLKHWLEFSPR